MITLYLARHGQTQENIARIFQGHLPGTLTEEGKRQATALGEELQQARLDAIISSDLKRVTDTVVLSVGKRDLPWEQTPLLREIDWGDWTGLPLASVNRNNLPSNAETRNMLYERAGRFLEHLKEHYDGKCVLAVAHGQINRAIEAHIRGIMPEDMPGIPSMQNAEVRKFILA